MRYSKHTISPWYHCRKERGYGIGMGRAGGEGFKYEREHEKESRDLSKELVWKACLGS